MTALLNRVRRLEPGPHCGHSVLLVTERLRATLAIIRRALPGDRGEAVVEELRVLWTRQ